MANNSIEKQVLEAQRDPQAADRLIEQYTPFIRREMARFTKRIPRPDGEELSIAMLAFYESIRAYTPGRGAFLHLAAAAIHNRLTDHARRESRHRGNVSLELAWGEDGLTLGETLPDEKDELAARKESRLTREEIEEFTCRLKDFGLSLGDVADSCPRQERTMDACMQALDYARENPLLLQVLEREKKLPLSRLALGAGVEKKTLERHRNYLVAILLAYTNGYEIIRGHLSRIHRRENP